MASLGIGNGGTSSAPNLLTEDSPERGLLPLGVDGDWRQEVASGRYVGTYAAGDAAAAAALSLPALDPDVSRVWQFTIDRYSDTAGAVVACAVYQDLTEANPTMHSFTASLSKLAAATAWTVGAWAVLGTVDADPRLAPGQVLQSSIRTGAMVPKTPIGLTSGQKWAEVEVWMLAGDSNVIGTDLNNNADLLRDFAPDLHVSQVSLGNAKAGQTVPPAGQLMPAVSPLQHDDVGDVGVGELMAWGRRARFPGIKHIILIPAGSSGSSMADAGTALPGVPGWDPANADPASLYNKALDMLTNVMQDVPNAVYMGELISSGALDGANPNWETQVGAIVAGFRGVHPSGDQAVTIFIPVPEVLAAGSPGVPAINERIREVESWLPRSSFVETSDLGTHDGRHYDTPQMEVIAYRSVVEQVYVADIGRRYTLKKQLLGWDQNAGEFVDLEGGSARVIDGVYEADPSGERGQVLRINNLGVETLLRLNTGTFALGLYVRRDLVGGSGNQNLLSFNNGTESIGFAFAWRAIIAQGLTTNSVSPQSLTGINFIPQNVWTHVLLTRNAGEDADLYIDKQFAGTIPSTQFGTLNDQRQLRIGAWQLPLTANSFRGHVDHVLVDGRKYTAADVAAL